MNLGFLARVARVVAGRTREVLPERTVEVGHPAIGAPDEMLEVVADPVPVAGWRHRRLYAPDDDALVVEGPKGVVYRPSRYGPDLGSKLDVCSIRRPPKYQRSSSLACGRGPGSSAFLPRGDPTG